MFRLRWFSQLVALASEATVHYQDAIFHSVLPDCLLVTETTGVCALTVFLFFLSERARSDFLIVRVRGVYFKQALW